MNTQTDRTVSSLFEYATRTDGTRYVRLGHIEDDMAWLSDAVHTAHDDELPNDWRYATCWHIVAALEDGAERDEIADSLVDVHTHDLIRWLGDDISRTAYCDMARDDGLLTDNADVLEIIGVGQFCAIDRMVHILADAIAENQS